MTSKSRTELYAAIRRDHRAGLGKRALMRKYGVGHPTVQKALESAWPQPRKKLPPRATRLDPFKSLVDEMLRADLDAPRKQRHTAKRVFDRLVDEHHADGISYGIVRAYVAVRRGEIRAEAGRGSAEVFVPQSHHPGQEAEVDFGDVTVHLAGQTLVCSLFSLRLSYSGNAVHRVFATSGQEAFLEGHVHALSVLGGVPRGKVRYDNLKAAVAKVIGFARERKESARWLAFREHYGVDSFYCRPGLVGAHEKGGVEGDIGRFRRNHFVPVPEVGSLAELNTLVERWDEEDEARRIRMRPRTVGEYFVVEQPLLAPLPTEPFDAGQVIETRVDRHSRIWARAGFYSVPTRYIERRVRIVLHANELAVYDGSTEIARHERLVSKAGERLELDHYLETLLRKPGALPGATALEQARQAGKFTPIHDAWWSAARKARGDKAGTKALIEVLLLHRRIPHEHLVAGLAASLRVGALTADAVALEARKAAESDDGSALVQPRDPSSVASLTQRRLAHLPPDLRPLPSPAVYDQLLHRRPAAPKESLP
ncbi:IS21 family transposase [Streptomyces europaeiscabiei]|uniref:IS21 family transposase n=1 Tax=Streptomyces europaeiscabiei TaxID=146819 RepID=UPI0038F6C45B